MFYLVNYNSTTLSISPSSSYIHDLLLLRTTCLKDLAPLQSLEPIHNPNNGCEGTDPGPSFNLTLDLYSKNWFLYCVRTHFLPFYASD